MDFRLLILTKFSRFGMNSGKLKAAFTAITDGYPIEEVSECLDWKDFEGEDPPDKEYYTDKQGRKQEKHTNYQYSQPPFKSV